MVPSSRSYMTLISILLCNPCRGPCGLSLNICIEKLNLLPFRYGGSVKNNGKRNTKVLSFSQNERQRAEWSRAWTYQYNENKLTGHLCAVSLVRFDRSVLLETASTSKI